MKRHRLAIGIGLLVVLVAVGLWRRCGGDGGASGGGSARVGTARAAGEGWGAGRAAALGDPRELPAGSIAGTIRGGDGAPLPGATVCGRAWSPALTSEETREPRCTTSGADGRYRLDRLVPAAYEVQASAPRHRSARYRDATRSPSVPVGSGERVTGIDLTLGGGAVEVHGVVRDIGGGGVPGALVWARDASRWQDAATVARADDQGRFTTWTRAGTVEVTAQADGYASGHATAAAPGTLIEVLLTPESVLAGRVIDAVTGEPVAGARVSVDESFGPGAESGSSTRTDAAGRFRLDRLEPGRYKPQARAPGRYGEASESILLGLGETRDDVIIQAHPAFLVTGRVVIEDSGRDCTAPSVRLREPDHEREYWAHQAAASPLIFEGVLPGSYQVTVWCPGYLTRDRYPRVEVVDADRLDLVWEVLAGATIAGRILGSDGAAVDGAHIYAEQLGDEPRGPRTSSSDASDAAGRFEMKGLAAGTYEVRAGQGDHPNPKQPMMVEVAAGATAEIEVRLPEGGQIEGIVVDELGAPVAGVNLELEGGSSWNPWASEILTRDDGTFVMPGVAPGTHRITAKRGWDRLRSPGRTDDDLHGERVRVRAGQVSRVRLVVESRRGVIRGRVLDGAGHPVTDAFLAAERESEAAGAHPAWAQRAARWSWWRRPVVTELDGSFVLAELASGSYTVRAHRQGGGEAFAVGVVVGSSITLRIEETSSLAGTVSLATGGAPEAFTILVSDRASGFRRTERFFRTGGHWSLTDLPPGELQVTANAGAGSAFTTITLEQGARRDGVALVLESLGTVTGRVVELDTGRPVPRVRVRDRAIVGAARPSWDDEDKKYITDADGRFTLARVAAGRVFIIAYPMDYDRTAHGFGRTIATVIAGNTIDVGEIRLPTRRLGAGDAEGDLGYDLVDAAPDLDPDDARFVVSHIRPNGPAADSGLRVGDEIVRVEGQEVRGAQSYLYWTLTRVPAGTTVELGLGRGETVRIRAGDGVE